MNSQCSVQLLESALAGELPQEAETTLHRHLEECAECSAAIERMAGGTEWCHEAATLLAGDDFDGAIPVRDDLSDVDFTVEHLDPADEPNLLGRLGGYDVLQVIGRGGMGVVLKAFDRELKRLVAIKVLSPHLAQSALAKKRFIREAQAAAAVVHPHVLAIHQVQPSGRLPFLVMPLVAGGSLAERLASQGTLELKEILRIGMQAGAGLAAAHEQGLVHRDVKPANILLEKGVERAVLTDFGLARAGDDVALTRWGVVAGTPQYMSPEQARGEPLDGRSDLFSLGCVLYEMATGVSPFKADSLMATMRRLVDDSPQAMGSLNPELPPWFVAIVDRLLEKDPSRRFGSAREVSELLEGCLAHVQQPRVVPLPAGCAAPRAADAAAAESAPKRSRRGWKLAAWGAVASTVLLAGILVVLELNKGKLIIESEVDDVPLRITQGENVVEKLTVSKVGKTIRVAAGKYVIELDPGAEDVAIKGAAKDGAVEIERGGRKIVKITRQEAAPADSPPVAPPPAPVLLVDAIRDFNKQAAKDPIGKAQPPLTEDEVVAFIRWTARRVLEFSDDERQQFRDIAEKGFLPPGWRFESVTNLGGGDRDTFRVWSVGLNVDRPDGSLVIRSQFLWPMDANGQPVELADVDLLPLPPDAKPLAAAIRSFNDGHRTLGGRELTPLTEHEIVAAIRRQKASRNELDVTNAEFRALQEIADRRQFPPGAEFEIITHFQPGDGYEYLIWSVRLSLPRKANDARHPRFNITIRDQFVRSELIDGGKIAWGPVAENGMQAGVRFEPHAEQHRLGDVVTPRFFYRNTGDQKRDVSFPRLMTHSYYDEIIVLDGAGRAIPIEQDELPAGPVGWLQIPFGFGAQHDIRGLPILLGEGERGGAETAIRVKRDQTVHVRFVVHNYLATDKKETIETGEVVFVAVQRPATQPQPKTKAAGPQRLHEFQTAERVKTIACSANGRLIAAANGNPTFPLREGWKRTVDVPDGETGETVVSLELSDADEEAVFAATEGLPHFEVGALAFSPGGNILAVGTGIGQVKLFDPRTGEILRSLDDEEAKQAEQKTPEILKSLDRAMGSVAALAFSPDGSLLATCGGSFEDIARSWGGIERLGLLATGPGRLKIWEVETGALKYDLVGHSHADAIAFSPDGNMLASAGRWSGPEHGTGVILWNPKTGEKLRTFPSEANGGTHAAAFSPDSKLLAIGSRIFDKDNDTSTTKIRLLHAGTGIMDWVHAVPGWANPKAFSPDGKKVVVLCGGESIQFLDAETGVAQQEIQSAGSPQRGRWTDFAIAPEARKLVIGGVDSEQNGTIEVWDLGP
jgi:hypothetical protein